MKITLFPNHPHISTPELMQLHAAIDNQGISGKKQFPHLLIKIKLCEVCYEKYCIAGILRHVYAKNLQAETLEAIFN